MNLNRFTVTSVPITFCFAVLLSAESSAQDTPSDADELWRRRYFEPSPREQRAPLPKRDENGSEASDWNFSVAPYFWLPAMNGTVTIRGRSATSDQTTQDVIDAVDNNLNLAGLLHLEASKNGFGVFADAIYFDFKKHASTRIATNVDARLQLLIGEVGGFYSLVPMKPAPSDQPDIGVDLLAGARVTWMKGTLNSTNFSSASRDTDWVDPFIGARTEVSLCTWLSVKLRGDIGGTGTTSGNSSRLVYNVDTALSLHFASWAGFDLGYRWLDYDYSDGSGTQRAKFDMRMSGPYAALVFRF